MFFGGGRDSGAYHFDIVDIIIVACALGVSCRNGLSMYCTAHGKRYCNVPNIVIKRPEGVISDVHGSIGQ